MDYQRIYTQFVADRKAREPALLASGEYKEVHHILPRSLGGSDEPENLVALTAEDHLRAHLLLAKIHGGVQWHVIDFVTHGHRSVPTKRMLRIAAQARKHRIKLISGANNSNFDDTVYTLVNDKGEIFTGTRVDFKKKYGVSARSNFNLLFEGKAVHGFYFPENRPLIGSIERNSGANNSQAVKQIITLYNSFGKVESGPQTELLKKLGINSSLFAKLVKNKRFHVNGWGLVPNWPELKADKAKKDTEAFTARRKSKPPVNRKAVICVETGVTYVSVSEAAKDVGLKSDVSIRKALRDPKKTGAGYRWVYA